MFKKWYQNRSSILLVIVLTHCGWWQYVWINWTNNGSDKGLPPSGYLNQCLSLMLIFNWTLGNKFQWNFKQNTTVEFSFKRINSKMSSNWRLFCHGPNGLKWRWHYVLMTLYCVKCVNTMRLDQNGWHFAHSIINVPLARYIKLQVPHAPGMPGTFPPPPRVCDPDMHHGTCVTHTGIAN